MKKSHILAVSIIGFLVLTVGIAPLSADSYTDLGTGATLAIIEESFAEAETNTASRVNTISREEIASYQAETTAQLVEKVIGTTFSSYGALGAAQNVQIRGASSDKTLVFLNGVPLGSAHEGSYDLSRIPVNMIERIEIIKSGPGNLGRTNAIGGMVNIITKSGAWDNGGARGPITVSFENGAYLPLTYGGTGEQNWLSFLDSQKLDIEYGTRLGDINMTATTGGLRAANAYTYPDGENRSLRTNAEVLSAHAGLFLDGVISERVHLKGNALTNWQRIGVPGMLSWPTPGAQQEDWEISGNQTVAIDAKQHGPIDTHTVVANGAFARTQYVDDGSATNDTHDKLRLFFQYRQDWRMDKWFALETGIDATVDHVQSSKIGSQNRTVPSVHANGGIYFAKGTFSIHPSVQLRYVSDTNAFSPNASVGMIYAPDSIQRLQATVSYAQQIPTFSQLYWPLEWGYRGNPDLKTEKGFNGDIGYTLETEKVRYEGSIFARDVNDAIVGDPNDNYIPHNIAHAFYVGTEQSVTWDPSDFFSFSVSYQYNRSFDLSNNHTFSDDIPVSAVRAHTLKTSLDFTQGPWNIIVFGEYLGSSQVADAVLLVDLTANMAISETVSTYVAIDNLLNVAYELYAGYPMPGMKIRVGGSVLL